MNSFNTTPSQFMCKDETMNFMQYSDLVGLLQPSYTTKICNICSPSCNFQNGDKTINACNLHWVSCQGSQITSQNSKNIEPIGLSHHFVKKTVNTTILCHKEFVSKFMQKESASFIMIGHTSKYVLGQAHDGSSSFGCRMLCLNNWG